MCGICVTVSAQFPKCHLLQHGVDEQIPVSSFSVAILGISVSLWVLWPGVAFLSMCIDSLVCFEGVCWLCYLGEQRAVNKCGLPFSLGFSFLENKSFSQGFLLEFWGKILSCCSFRPFWVPDVSVLGHHETFPASQILFRVRVLFCPKLGFW